MRALLIPLLAFFASDQSAGHVAPACIGEGAAVHLVYLHGMGREVPSQAELDVLRAFAKAHHARIALPRATRSCPSEAGSSCWGWAFDDDEREAAAYSIDAASAACFSPNEPYGLLGFSNGGYAVLELVAHDEVATRLPRAQWIVAVGASSDVSDPFLASAALGAEPPVVMVAGELDAYNFDASDRYAKRLASAGARVASVHYPGGHDLAAAPVAEAIARAESMLK